MNYEKLTFAELRTALREAVPKRDMTDDQLDSLIVAIWVRVVMRRLGIVI